MRIRTHRQESFTVYNCDSRYSVRYPRRTSEEEAQEVQLQHAYVRSASRHAHAYADGVRVPRLSFVDARQRTSFRERAPLPPIRGHAHDTRPRAPGGAFNARSLSSTRERGSRGMPGVKARPPRRGVRRRFSASATPNGPSPIHRVRPCFTAYLPRERNTTSPGIGKLRIAYDENIKVARNLILKQLRKINKSKR